ncbi:MAG: MFS transporter, partial [Steroidobacteraceae bacterium]
MSEDSGAEYVRHGTRAFRRINLALFAAGSATFGLLYCVQPLLPQFTREYGVSAAASALSLSLTTAVLAIGMLVAGALSEAWGRKPIMLGSILMSSLLVLASALMSDWTSLLVSRALLGLALSGLPAVAMTYLAEEVDAASIGLGMGLYIGGNAIGGLAGRVITGVLSDFVNWRIGVIVVAAIGFACALSFWRLLPPSRHFVARPLSWRALGARLTVISRDPGLPWLFAEGSLLLGAFVTVYNFIGYRLLAPPYDLSQAAVGAIFAIYLVGTVSSPWVGHLSGRLGRRKVLWTMLALVLIGTALTVLASLWAILLGVAVLTFGFFGGHSVVSSWVGRRAGPAKAYASSLYLFCYYAGSSIAGTCGGLFYASHGWNGVAWFVG